MKTIKPLKLGTIMLVQLQAKKDRSKARLAKQPMAVAGLDLYRTLDRYKPVNQ